MQKYDLLIVEDDLELAELTAEFFAQYEFNCSIEPNGEKAVKLILDTQPDLVFLDLMLPGLDGMQVCRLVKGKFKGRLVMLTARTDTIEQVLGLEIGADDYIAKPIEPRLLLAKARAVLRRNPVQTSNQDVQYFNHFEVHKHKREVVQNGNTIPLTTPEYDLLELLTKHQGQVISRDDIFQQLKGVEYDGQSRQVDIHISNLRAKLETTAATPTIIKTVRSKGYLFTG